MKSTMGFCAMAATAAGLLLMPVANAQNQSPSTPPSATPKSTTAPTNIPDKKLDATAAAVKRVTAVRENYEQKLSKAPDADKEKIVGEANEAISKAVTDQGLSIEEYTSIMRVAQNDPVVRDKLLQRLK